MPLHRSTLLVPALAVALVPGAAHAAARPATPSFHDVPAVLETPTLFDDAAGGHANADDPAIWVHPTHREASLVIGTAKNAGLRVYDLHGRQVQAIAAPAAPGPGAEPGRFNNVDLVASFALGGRRVDLAVVTDRGRDRLRVYRIDPDAAARGAAPLVDVTAADAPRIFAADEAEVDEQNTAYGLATYTAGDDAYAVVSRRHRTTLSRVELVARNGRVSYEPADSVRLPSTFRLPNGADWTPCAEPGEQPQVEGMVVDPAAGVLYAAQEDVGLWRVPLDAGGFDGAPSLLQRVREYGVPATYDPDTEECTPHPDQDPGFGGPIAADVEGLTIYPTGRHSGYLLVSGQGDSTFHVFDRAGIRPLGTFHVTDGPDADGAQHSDGAAVVSTPLPGYPHGLLVVQDGVDTPDVGRTATDFTYVDWRCAGLLPRGG
ncbi:phytase [Krasilnikovia sp. MM14-A1004]|uniref:phytase n=1 Tax=Krasilnikovia sp. MM14-A1004 TaxID=3373541 RepID=UPI00399C7BD9